MTADVVFLATETAGADSLFPLWRRWAETRADGFRILAGKAALARLEHLDPSYHLPRQAMCDEAIGYQLDECRPRRLVVHATGLPVEKSALLWARDHDVAIDQYIETWYGYARRLSFDGVVLTGDRLLLVDDRAIAEAQAEGVPAAVMVAAGHPGWEHAARPDLPTRPATVFLGQPLRKFYGDALGYCEATAWEVVKRAAANRPDLFGPTCYAMHPAEDAAVVAQQLDGAELIHSRAAIARCNIVTGCFASPMVEALLAGRLVCSIQPGQTGGKDHCPLSRHRRAPRVSSATELTTVVANKHMSDGTSLDEVLRGSTDRLERLFLEGM